MVETTTNQVKRRRVFYIPGYDPMPPRRYRELYRTESKSQSDISSYDIALAPKTGGDVFGWTVEADIDGQQVSSQIDVLVWSDIVKSSMTDSVAGTYKDMLRTAWTYIGSGALFSLMKLRKGPVIAALYPIGMLILQLFIAMIVAVSLYSFLARFTDFGLVKLIFATLCFVVGYCILEAFKRFDGKFFAYYLMHDYAYSASTNGANPPALETRMTKFRSLIEAALQTDADEVLVVGHSSGAHLGVSILADLLRAGPQPKLAFLSLGQVVPMVSFLPDAHRLRADLAYLSTQDMPWVDVTAPGDGCSFALCDPVAVTGVAPNAKRWPLVFSAAFTQSLSPARWKELRWKFFRLHFQYLCAFDRPKDYDYFQITAGPVTLRDRFKDRVASKSRIETPVNRYTGTTP